MDVFYNNAAIHLQFAIKFQFCHPFIVHWPFEFWLMQTDVIIFTDRRLQAYCIHLCMRFIRMVAPLKLTYFYYYLPIRWNTPCESDKSVFDAIASIWMQQQTFTMNLNFAVHIWSDWIQTAITVEKRFCKISLLIKKGSKTCCCLYSSHSTLPMT